MPDDGTDGLAGGPGFDSNAVPVDDPVAHQEQHQYQEQDEPGLQDLVDDGVIESENFLFSDEYQREEPSSSTEGDGEGEEPAEADTLNREQIGAILAEQAAKTQEQMTQWAQKQQEVMNQMHSQFMGMLAQMGRIRQQTNKEPNLTPSVEDFENMTPAQFHQLWSKQQGQMQNNIAGVQQQMKHAFQRLVGEIRSMNQEQREQQAIQQQVTELQHNEKMIAKKFPEIGRDPKVLQAYRRFVGTQYKNGGGDLSKIDYVQAAKDVMDLIGTQSQSRSTQKLPPGAQLRKSPKNLKGSGSKPKPVDYDFKKIEGIHSLDDPEWERALLATGVPDVASDRRR